MQIKKEDLMYITLKYFSAKRNETPHDTDAVKSYTFVVDATHVPGELEAWRKINPRDPNTKTDVAKAIRRTLIENPSMFFFMNRGLVILADKAHIDNAAKTVRISLVDKEKHGLLDGGHTFRVLQEYLEEYGNDGLRGNCAVTMQVMTGIDDRDDIVNLVAARNLSRKVPEEGLLNQRGLFECVKKVLKGNRIEGMVAYKHNEESDDGHKPISINDLVSTLVCFDIDHFDSMKQPIKAYGSWHAALEHFQANEKRMEKLVRLLPEILKLWDTIYLTLPECYKKCGGGGKDGKGAFGGLVGVKQPIRRITLDYTGKTSEYDIPKSYIYPLLAACRALVRKDGSGNYSWIANPSEMFVSLAPSIMPVYGKAIRDTGNPRQFGRDIAAWQNCYFYLENAVLRMERAA